MRGPVFRRLATVALLCIFALSVSSAAGELISVMRNVNAVGEHQGFRINPAYDSAAPMGPEDLAPVQAFEILRPQGRPVTLGRLYTSCTCIRLEAAKRTFGPDERVVLQLRNIKPTPMNGQVYAIYVQITSPVHATLRFDTFVQSNSVIVTEDSRSSAASAPVPAPDATVVADGSDIEVIVPRVEPEETPTTEPEAAATEDRDGDAAEPAAETAETPEKTEDPVADAMDAYFSDGGDTAPADADSTTGDAFSGLDTAPEMPAAPALTLPGVGGAASAEATPVPAPLPPPGAEGTGSKKAVKSVSLITIGVRDMAKSIAFYEALGWRRAARNKYDQTAFFQLDGQVLALYPMQDLMKEQNMASSVPAPGGITLAIHVTDKAEVAELYRNFLNAGGSSLKAPTEMPSGAVTCYVADPDGNPWEISWVPQFRLDKDGGLWLP